MQGAGRGGGNRRGRPDVQGAGRGGGNRRGRPKGLKATAARVLSSWQKLGRMKEKCCSSASESDLDDNDYLAAFHPSKVDSVQWTSEDEDSNIVRFWWEDMIHERVDSSISLPGNGVFDFDSNFVYDAKNNVVGQGEQDDENYHDTRPGNPDPDVMRNIRGIDAGNFDQLQAHFDCTDLDMIVYSALHQELCSALSNGTIVDQSPKPGATRRRSGGGPGTRATGRLDSHLLISFFCPVLSSCVPFVAKIILDLYRNDTPMTLDDIKKELKAIRSQLLLTSFRDNSRQYHVYAPPNDYFHPNIMKKLFAKNDIMSVNLPSSLYDQIYKESFKNGFFIIGTFHMNWEPYKKYMLWNNPNDIHIKWDIEECKNHLWYGFKLDQNAPDAKERLHVIFVYKGRAHCNNLYYKRDGETYDHFDIPFDLIWKIYRTNNSHKTQYIADATNRMSYFTNISKVVAVMRVEDHEDYKIRLNERIEEVQKTFVPGKKKSNTRAGRIKKGKGKKRAKNKKTQKRKKYSRKKSKKNDDDDDYEDGEPEKKRKKYSHTIRDTDDDEDDEDEDDDGDGNNGGTDGEGGDDEAKNGDSDDDVEDGGTPEGDDGTEGEGKKDDEKEGGAEEGKKTDEEDGDDTRDAGAGADYFSDGQGGSSQLVSNKDTSMEKEKNNDGNDDAGAAELETDAEDGGKKSEVTQDADPTEVAVPESDTGKKMGVEDGKKNSEDAEVVDPIEVAVGESDGDGNTDGDKEDDTESPDYEPNSEEDSAEDERVNREGMNDNAVASLVTHFDAVRRIEIVGVVQKCDIGDKIRSDAIEKKKRVINDQLDKGVSESGGIPAKSIDIIDGVGSPQNSGGSDGDRGIGKKKYTDNGKAIRSTIEDGKKPIKISNKKDVADNSVGRGNDRSVATFTDKPILSVATSAGKTITPVGRKKTPLKTPKKSSPQIRRSPRNDQPMQTRRGYHASHRSHQERTRHGGQIKVSSTQSASRPQPLKGDRPQNFFQVEKNLQKKVSLNTYIAKITIHVKTVR